MQTYMNIRHLFSVKDSPPQINLALLSSKRSHQNRKFANRSYTALIPNTRLRNLAVAVCRSDQESKRSLLLGARSPYCITSRKLNVARAFDKTTKASLQHFIAHPQNQELSSVPVNGSVCDANILSLKTGAANTTNTVDKLQDVGEAIPSEEDYNGFGKVLLQSPKSSLHSDFVQKGLIGLNARFVGLDKGRFDCFVDCTIQHASTTITTCGTGKSKSSAELQALLALISKLHTNGLLQELNTLREESRYLKLHIDDDMHIVMLRSLKDLRYTHHLSTTKPSGGRRRTSTSANPKGLEQYKRDQSLRIAIADSKPRKLQERLPISRRKDEILELVERNTYSLISADTGSGKSTQVPQILLDDAMANGCGTECNVLCVQPRRMAATSLARRVAEERGESLGCSVGYQIRFDSRRPSRLGSITYCTTGFLLNMMHSTAYLGSFSHIMLDEVHERALDLDLLMLLLRKFVEQRQALGLCAPKIVVMSATLDIDLFASYFQNSLTDGSRLPAPHLHIPGRAFPVGKHYLDEIVESLAKFYSPQALSSVIDEPQTAKYLRKHNLLSNLLSMAEHRTTDEPEVNNNQPSNGPTFFMSREEDDSIPVGLICAVICHVLCSSDKGSILVFLPGLRHIMKAEAAVRKYGKVLGCDFSNENLYRILQLHSNLPDGQKELFRPVPRNCRRIILSTDIAETSITIPDVKYVIDPGKVNQRIYEPKSKTTRLACCWISQSSSAQRAGRAGRVQEGEYFALFTRDMHNYFRSTRFPGMLREDLQQTCLQVKRAALTASIQDTLRESIEPPAEAKVNLAVSDLQLLRALDEQEELTPLGSLLSEMSLDPCRAKLVLLGIIFRCLDPLLIIGAIAGDQSLFYLSTDRETRKAAHRSRIEFSRNTWSDHLSAVNAFKATRDVWYRTDRATAFEFAISNHIHFDRVCEVLQIARHTLRYLAKEKLISSHARLDEHFQFGGAELNVNSWRTPLIKALLFHVMYPNLAAPSVSRRRYFTETNKTTHMSPSSVNFTGRSRSLFIFDSLNKPPSGDTLFLKQTSHVTPLAACLLGGRLQGSSRKVRMDSWLDFVVKANDRTQGDRAVRLLIEFRKSLQMAFDTAFDTLSCPENHQSTNDLGPKSASSRDLLFNTISNTVIDILDQDVDPV
ncbi:P-loop containing nucleoside triphosphate hydrolase protein [Aspergillus coremiiformis]|uniref:RNA helicase n=1 Tax=Aspergillus coremiiformis TaxID=138285 RepID=A0A5N6Z198_9EURO|nr:P-loop containing nucleoside triphosphate hydrolase protein [Aspergillus coremiiformis]